MNNSIHLKQPIIYLTLLILLVGCNSLMVSPLFQSQKPTIENTQSFVSVRGLSKENQNEFRMNPRSNLIIITSNNEIDERKFENKNLKIVNEDNNRLNGQNKFSKFNVQNPMYLKWFCSKCKSTNSVEKIQCEHCLALKKEFSWQCKYCLKYNDKKDKKCKHCQKGSLDQLLNWECKVQFCGRKNQLMDKTCKNCQTDKKYSEAINRQQLQVSGRPKKDTNTNVKRFRQPSNFISQEERKTDNNPRDLNNKRNSNRKRPVMMPPSINNNVNNQGNNLPNKINHKNKKLKVSRKPTNKRQPINNQRVLTLYEILTMPRN